MSPLSRTNSAVVPENQKNKPIQDPDSPSTTRTRDWRPPKSRLLLPRPQAHCSTMYPVAFAADAASKSVIEHKRGCRCSCSLLCLHVDATRNRFACSIPNSTRQSFSSPGAASLIMGLETEEPRIPGAASLTSPGATPAAREQQLSSSVLSTTALFEAPAASGRQA